MVFFSKWFSEGINIQFMLCKEFIHLLLYKCYIFINDCSWGNIHYPPYHVTAILIVGKVHGNVKHTDKWRAGIDVYLYVSIHQGFWHHRGHFFFYHGSHKSTLFNHITPYYLNDIICSLHLKMFSL